MKTIKLKTKPIGKITCPCGKTVPTEPIDMNIEASDYDRAHIADYRVKGLYAGACCNITTIEQDQLHELQHILLQEADCNIPEPEPVYEEVHEGDEDGWWNKDVKMPVLE